MRIAITIFYWLCAAALIALSLHSEREEEKKFHAGKPSHPGTAGRH